MYGDLVDFFVGKLGGTPLSKQGCARWMAKEKRRSKLRDLLSGDSGRVKRIYSHNLVANSPCAVVVKSM
jgi:hypothetical protein